MAAGLEKEFGTPVQVVNKPGAGAQVGTTDLVLSKADGYTIEATNLPTTLGIYLDPERQAAFSRKDLQQVALHVDDPALVAVSSESPYMTMKDLLDAAKANPEGIKAASTGVLSHDHLNALMWEKLAGVKFAVVQFDGGAPALTALVGGHVDAFFGNIGSVTSLLKDGKIRILGMMAKEENKFAPGVKTMEAAGVQHLLLVLQRLFGACWHPERGRGQAWAQP